MKRMKKVLAMLLAMAMVLGMSMTTFAAGEKITIAYPDDVDSTDAVVMYDKIIEEDMESTLGWKFVKEYEQAFVNGFYGRSSDTSLGDTEPDAVIAALIELGKVPKQNNVDVNKYVKDGKINIDNGNEAFHGGLAAVASSLKEKAANKTEFEPNKGKGLYAISINATGSTFSPMAVYVSPDFAGLAITAKGSKDQVDKKLTTVENGPDNTSVSEGDVVPFTVTDMYPFFATKANDRTYILTDTVTGGTIDADSLVVKIGETAVYSKASKSEGVFNSVDIKDGGFTLDFAYNREYAGQQVTVTYNVNVTAGDNLNNTVESKKDSKKTQSIVIIPKVDAEITKVDESEQVNGVPKTLEGAEFELYEQLATGDTSTPTHYVISENEKNVIKVAENGKVVDGGTALKVVTWASTEEDKTESKQVTNAQGIATFNQLDADKTYWVVETKAPEGYTLNDEAKMLKFEQPVITETVNTEVVETEGGDKIPTRTTEYKVQVIEGKLAVFETTVNDTKLSALPSTGGIGTTIFTVGGCAIMILAAGLFFASRRKAMK